MRHGTPPPAGPHPEPSAAFLAGLRAGEDAAWVRLHDFYVPILRRWCRRAGVGGGVLDDVVQDILTTLARSLPTFSPARGSGSFVAFLFTIARTRTRNHLDRAGRHPAGAGGSDHRDWLENQPAPADESSGVAVPERLLVLRRALDVVREQFEARTWRAFWETELAGRETAEVAAELGMSPGAVLTAKSRVRARVRAVYAEMAG